MTTPEGLTNEERAAYWRELRMKPFQDDPEMLEIIRKAKFDFEVPWESTPEESAEDIRIARERAAKSNGESRSLEEVLRDLAEEFPDEAEDILRGL